MKRSGAMIASASITLFAYHMVDHFDITLGAKTETSTIYYLDLTLWCMISAVGVVMAFLLIRATGAFTAVIHTEGNDLEHRMHGMTRLRDILKWLFSAGAVGSASFALMVVYS